jgi:hypothetical protein
MAPGAMTQVIDDARAVFARHATIERALIDWSWSLEGFESHALTPNKSSHQKSTTVNRG